MNAYDEWKQLTLSQFWGKRILGGIMRAICEELQEVYEIQQQLRTLTNIDTQEGVNLDHIGDIVCVSREDAQEILLKDESFEMTDELYRNVLKFMIALHGSSATYYDIIDGIRLIWNLENVKYLEKRDQPASYTLDLGERRPSDDNAANSRTLTIKAAGVKVRYIIRWLMEASHQEWRTKVQKVIYENKIPIFGGVRRLDGSLQLDGSYQLDAAIDGNGAIDYHLHSGMWSMRSSVVGVCEIPQRLIVRTADTDNLRVTDQKSAVIGLFGNELSASPEADGLQITSSGDPQVLDDLIGFSVSGTQERSVMAKECIVSWMALTGQFVDDGILIQYEADAAFDTEIAPVKTY